MPQMDFLRSHQFFLNVIMAKCPSMDPDPRKQITVSKGEFKMFHPRNLRWFIASFLLFPLGPKLVSIVYSAEAHNVKLIGHCDLQGRDALQIVLKESPVLCAILAKKRHDPKNIFLIYF